jgi:hypothetical protein
MKNDFVSLLLAVFVLMASSGIVSATDYIVNNNSSIQASVDNVTSNGSIVQPVLCKPIIYNGTSNGSIIAQPGTHNEDDATNGNNLTQTDNVAPVEPTSAYNASVSESNSSAISKSYNSVDNVQAKEVAQSFVIGGENTTFNFTENATCVESITFISDKTLGEISATVEELKNKVASVPCPPEGNVYKFFDVLIGNGDDLECIRNASINFSVNNSWIQENNINQSSIALNEYNNTSKEWEQLPVNISGNDSERLHLTANVPSYSSFAITTNESDV